MAIFVIALVRIGADATELIGVEADGGVATTSAGASFVARDGAAAGAVGVAGASTTGLGATGSMVFTGTGIGTTGCCGTPGSSSYSTIEESSAVMSDTSAVLSSSTDSENEFDDAGC